MTKSELNKKIKELKIKLFRKDLKKWFGLDVEEKENKRIDVVGDKDECKRSNIVDCRYNNRNDYI